MKFRFIKKDVDQPTIGYQGTKVKTGDIVELYGDFIDKAISNPDYEMIKMGRPKKPERKIKRGENQE